MRPVQIDAAFLAHQPALVCLPLVAVCHPPVACHLGVGDAILAAIVALLRPDVHIMDPHVPFHIPHVSNIPTYITDALRVLHHAFKLLLSSRCMLRQLMFLKAVPTGHSFAADVAAKNTLVALGM